jgi:hypothetical protein
MQLGEGALMSDTDPMEHGVAVNLIWGSPGQGRSDNFPGLMTHEGLGYVADGAVTQIATVSSGKAAITVRVDLDRQTYSASVGGQQVAANIPFAQQVSGIDMVRFFAHELNRENFAVREIDNVVVR